MKLRAAACLLLPFVAALAPVADAEPVTRMPGPARAGYLRGGRADEDAACAKCHGEVAREHDASLHKKSFDDASFQRGYGAEPTAFCRSCHAPEADPRTEPDGFARTHGVACITCHKPDPAGPILASASPSSARAPHAVARVTAFGSRACASCHEFAFPGAEALGDKGRMQKTVSEHAASAARDRTCAECHMPKDEAGRSAHRFAASRDPALLARSVSVAVERKDDVRVELTVRARDVGHALPTGDLFRRLLLRVSTPRGVVERPLGRTFRARRDEQDRVVRFEASDERPAPEQHIVLLLPAAPGMRYELLYQRVVGVAQTPPFAANVEDETVIARGDL